ncbi:hypothetical protein BDV34DRAFT_185662, partial [Aspergillus parasiticus]
DCYFAKIINRMWQSTNETNRPSISFSGVASCIKDYNDMSYKSWMLATISIIASTYYTIQLYRRIL